MMPCGGFFPDEALGFEGLDFDALRFEALGFLAMSSPLHVDGLRATQTG
jgi:hypothetical protein